MAVPWPEELKLGAVESPLRMGRSQLSDCALADEMVGE
jgi:hypothetical protein